MGPRPGLFLTQPPSSPGLVPREMTGRASLSKQRLRANGYAFRPTLNAPVP
jgi:hypothetical protein